MQRESTRTADLRKGLWLEYFTIGWNLLEAVVGLGAGLIAGSLALIGFALDSVVEASSGTILLWRFRAERRGASAEAVEYRAIRLVAVAFFALALYVGGRAVMNLATGVRPEASVIGIVLAISSLIVMPALAWRKRNVARSLNSRALEADSTQTIMCMYLSIVLLLGLVANSELGWWWADPVAALAIAGLAAKEGFEYWNDEH
jgi:divalent metal cation (Fe/Co/Zn/Cd) transporter